MGQSLSDSNIFHMVLAHKTAFCAELNVLTPFSFGNDNCLIVEIILHLNAPSCTWTQSNQQRCNSCTVKW